MTTTKEACANSTRPVDRLEAAGRAAAANAEWLWRQDVIDPPIGSKLPRAAESLAVINAIIRRNGWTWTLPYRGNGPPRWCGMTAGACWADAGLDSSWLVDYFASTDRLLDWARYKRFRPTSKANPVPAPGTGRRLLVDLRKPIAIAPRLGDIVLVGNGKRYAGDHVTINMGFDGKTFDTISGNGGGIGPNGDKREGISRRDYAIGAKSGYAPMWLIRPALGDLVL